MSKKLNPGAAPALCALLAVLLPLSLLWAQASGPAPKVTIALKDRHGHAAPERVGFTHTGGGNTIVDQPSPDTVVITMTGVAVAGPHPYKASAAALDFDLTQGVDIVFADAKLKKAKLTIEAQISGLLRGDKRGGNAGVCNGAAAITVGNVSILAVAIEGHAVTGGDNLSINDHKGPASVPVTAGEYNLFQGFRISAAHTRGLCGKAASAEFAPDPALDPLWISYWEPFHGAAKKDFGFKVTYRVEAE